jgi:hypothetical protein
MARHRPTWRPGPRRQLPRLLKSLGFVLLAAACFARGQTPQKATVPWLPQHLNQAQTSIEALKTSFGKNKTLRQKWQRCWVVFNLMIDYM